MTKFNHTYPHESGFLGVANVAIPIFFREGLTFMEIVIVDRCFSSFVVHIFVSLYILSTSFPQSF